MPCVDPNHFLEIDGVIAPQPWMQWRRVTTAKVASKAGSYAVTGTAKNDLLHTVSTSWTNDSPIAQRVYGLCTRGGSQVTLQARSRGYLALYHGQSLDDPVVDGDMVLAARDGTGADIGRAGLLAIGTGFCEAETRRNASTLPFMPAFIGWLQLNAGHTLYMRADLRFVSEFWENTTIDGGSASTESSYITGDTRLDLYAVPVIP